MTRELVNLSTIIPPNLQIPRYLTYLIVGFGPWFSNFSLFFYQISIFALLLVFFIWVLVFSVGEFFFGFLVLVMVLLCW